MPETRDSNKTSSQIPRKRKITPYSRTPFSSGWHWYWWKERKIGNCCWSLKGKDMNVNTLSAIHLWKFLNTICIRAKWVWYLHSPGTGEISVRKYECATHCNVSCMFRKMMTAVIVLTGKLLLESGAECQGRFWTPYSRSCTVCLNREKSLWPFNLRTPGRQRHCETLYHLATHVYLCTLEGTFGLGCCRTLPPVKPPSNLLCLCVSVWLCICFTCLTMG